MLYLGCKTKRIRSFLNPFLLSLFSSLSASSSPSSFPCLPLLRFQDWRQSFERTCKRLKTQSQQIESLQQQSAWRKLFIFQHFREAPKVSVACIARTHICRVSLESGLKGVQPFPNFSCKNKLSVPCKPLSNTLTNVSVACGN